MKTQVCPHEHQAGVLARRMHQQSLWFTVKRIVLCTIHIVCTLGCTVYAVQLNASSCVCTVCMTGRSQVNPLVAALPSPPWTSAVNLYYTTSCIPLLYFVNTILPILYLNYSPHTKLLSHIAYRRLLRACTKLPNPW